MATPPASSTRAGRESGGPSRLAGALGRARELRRFLETPIAPQEAVARMRADLERREDRFLESLRQLVYDDPQSPYLRLLRAADCSYADAEAMVRDRGLEQTLRQLRDAGVYVTAAEWKGTAPVVREHLEFDVSTDDFVNHRLTDALAQSRTSGSSGSAARSMSLSKIELTAASSRLVTILPPAELADTRVAVWMPGPPSAGTAVVLRLAKLGNVPDRWFSQTPVDGSAAQRMIGWLRPLATLGTGSRLPRPRYTPLDEALKVAEWLSGQPSPRAVYTYASSAVRAALAAHDHGVDIAGAVFIVGGEPVSADRHALLESVGARVVGIYAAAEVGVMAVGCGVPGAADDYHVDESSVALVPASVDDAGEPVPLLITSLSPSAPRVLLNADIGDTGLLERRACGCRLHDLGLDLHVANIRSRAVHASEGMTVPLHQLWEVARVEVAASGGSRDDCQVRQIQDENGLARIVLAVSPRLDIDGNELVNRVLHRLGEENAGAKLAAEIWRQAGTLRIVREQAQPSPRGKIQPVLPLVAAHGPAAEARDEPGARRG